MVLRGQTLGKYRLLEPLGSGGFGTVYLAEDTWIDKRVAIKIPHRQNLDFGELLREPRLLASLNHPNVVTVITAEKQDNVFFIVMEYVPGETLETIIAARGALDLPLALDYTCQIVNAVEHAHRQGVLHRDLRPANVFVTERGLLKVGDFGTSRFLEIAAHGTTVIGSPPYMAPEQFEGRAVFASDLYSLGVSMYQMLTGVLPYDMPAPSDLDRLRTGELITSPRLRNPAIPPVIDQIVLKALSADVGARYQRAEDLLTDLLAARRDLVRRPAGEPLSPAPAGRIGAVVAGAGGFGGSAAERARPLDGSGANDAGHGSRRVDVPAAVDADDAVDLTAPGPPSPPRPIDRPGHRPAAPRLRTREVGASRFCWHCRKPLPARGASCPFCGERQ